MDLRQSTETNKRHNQLELAFYTRLEIVTGNRIIPSSDSVVKSKSQYEMEEITHFSEGSSSSENTVSCDANHL